MNDEVEPMTKHQQYETIFNMFTGDNDFYPVLKKPFRQGDYYISCDTESMAILHTGVIHLPFEEELKPDCLKIIPEVTEGIEIDIPHLKSQLIPNLINETVRYTSDCESCDGTGEVDFEYDWKGKSYTSQQDCPVCNGTGRTEHSRVTDNMVPNEYTPYNFLGSTYSHFHLTRLVKTANILNVDKITKLAGEGIRAGLFAVGNMKVLIMPVFADPTAKEITPIS